MPQVKPCDPMVEWHQRNLFLVAGSYVCTDPEGSPAASNLNTTGMRFRGDFSPQSFSDNLTGCLGVEIINLTMYIYIYIPIRFYKWFTWIDSHDGS